MILLKVDTQGVAILPFERYSPRLIDSNRMPPRLGMQRVQPPARNTQVVQRLGSMQRLQAAADVLNKVGADAARVSFAGPVKDEGYGLVTQMVSSSRNSPARTGSPPGEPMATSANLPDLRTECPPHAPGHARAEHATLSALRADHLDYL